MKKIIFTLLLLSYFSANSQTLTEKEIVKLNELNIQIKNLDLNNTNTFNDIKSIITLGKKAKTNKILAIVFSASSLTGLITGTVLLSKARRMDNAGSPYVTTLGSMMLAGGVIYGGISVPFWIASKKRERERMHLIEMYRE